MTNIDDIFHNFNKQKTIILMKQFCARTALLFLFVFLCKSAIAQMIGTDIFMQATHCELGIDFLGAYGTNSAAPSGYYANTIATGSGYCLGFVADPDEDGWTVGTPNYFGDYFLPGDPVEGWAIQVAGTRNDAYYQNYNFVSEYGSGGLTLTGNNVSYTQSGAVMTACWQGTAYGNLSITQVTVLDTDKMFWVATITLTNTGTSTFKDIYYMRELDPDNEEPETGSFVTTNTIVYPGPDSVLVSAVGTEYPPRSYLGLGAKSSNAMVFWCNFGLLPSEAEGLDQIYSKTATDVSYSGTTTNDVGMGLVFHLADLPADSTESFKYTYIVRNEDFDAALEATVAGSAGWSVNGVAVSDTADTVLPCSAGTTATTINILNGDGYSSWSWSPATGLSGTTGTSNTITTVSSTAITYTITGTPSCGFAPRTFLLSVLPGVVSPPIVTSPVNYCQGTMASPLTAIGSNLLWYIADTGGTGSSIAFTPSTSTPGITTYYVSQTIGICESPRDSISVDVIAPAGVTDGSNSPLCAGSTLLLTANSTSPDVTYSWAGPAGFGSAAQNPVIPGVTTAASGIYTVIVTFGICTSTDTVSVLINPIPTITSVSNNGPICSGATLNFSTNATPAGGNYNWSGPSGYSTSVQNPAIINAQPDATGTYTVTYSLNGCVSPPAYDNAVVNLTPAVPTVSNNSPLCAEHTLLLTGSTTTPEVGYKWSGPGGFISTTPDTSIMNALTTASGIYTLTVTLGPCSDSATTSVIVNPIPENPVVSSNSPVCSGDTLLLFATSNPGSVYHWTGPYTFIDSTQNPQRYFVTTEYGGIYTVYAVLNNCPALEPGYDTVIIHQTPPPPWLTNLTYCQFAYAPALTATGENILWYPTGAATGTGSPVMPTPSTDTVGVTYFYATQTVQGCMSAVDSVKVKVLPKPSVALIPQNIALCPGDTVVLSAIDTSGAINFYWEPKLYLDSINPVTVVVRPVTDVDYYVLVSNKYGCTDTANTNVTVHPNAVMNMPDSITLYPGEVYQIDPSTNCLNFLWFPEIGLSGSTISNPVAAPEVSTKYVVRASTEWGCTVIDSIKVNVDPGTLLAMPNAFSPGTGVNNEFKVIKRGIATLNYFRIFDRWGVKVFETTNIDQGWDGTYNGTPQPFGVYVYEVEAVTNTGKVFIKQGNVTLVR